MVLSPFLQANKCPNDIFWNPSSTSDGPSGMLRYSAIIKQLRHLRAQFNIG